MLPMHIRFPRRLDWRCACARPMWAKTRPCAKFSPSWALPWRHAGVPSARGRGMAVDALRASGRAACERHRRASMIGDVDFCQCHAGKDGGTWPSMRTMPLLCAMHDLGCSPMGECGILTGTHVCACRVEVLVGAPPGSPSAPFISLSLSLFPSFLSSLSPSSSIFCMPASSS